MKKEQIKEISIYLAIILGVILIRIFIISPVRVDGPSMNDNLFDGDLLFLKKFDRSFDRFDIVVFNYNNARLVKRVIGLPGEHVSIEDNKLYINGKFVEQDMIEKSTADFDLSMLGYEVIPTDYYFVLGDNRSNSLDSRYFGLVKKSDILGTVDFRFFPFNKIGSIR